MQIIDCHNHPDWQGQDSEAFIREMDRLGIDQCWMQSWEAPLDDFDPAYLNRTCPLGPEYPIPFSRVLHYAERHPDRFIPGYCPDPRRPDAIARLEAAVSIYGVRICGEWKLRMLFDNPDSIALFRRAGELGLPVVIHLDYPLPRQQVWPRPNYWYGGSMDAFERALAACPDTLFLGHAPGFWAHMTDDGQHETCSYPKGAVTPDGRIERMLERYPNLYCDLSGGSGFNALNRDHGNARRFLTRWQDRVLYGRDDVGNIHLPLIDSLGLDDDIRRKVYAGNARRLLGEAETDP